MAGDREELLPVNLLLAPSCFEGGSAIGIQNSRTQCPAIHSNGDQGLSMGTEA
jgi:hypothetical protein